MPFTRNDKNINREGRPKQTTQTNSELKALLKALFNENLEFINLNKNELTIRDKININKYILPYILPKLNNITLNENEKNYFEPITINIGNNDN